MTTKRFFASLLAAMMLLVNFSSVTQAADTDPYCRISYDSAVGCNSVKYYSYNNGVARYDASRLVKFYDGKILLGTSNTVVTSSHKAGTNPAWTTDGSYLVWIESDGTLWSRSYTANQNVKLADAVSSLGLNAESMVEMVSFADGTSSAISSLISPPTVTPEPTPVVETPSSDIPIASVQTVTTNVRQLKEWTDNQGREHFEFGNNKLIVDGKKVYLNNFMISELCNSGVRFVGIDSSYRVYLYEDASNSYYRFSPKNIFVPKKIQFAKKGKLVSVVNDENGFLKEVVTSAGTFKLSQLTKQKKWTPPISYAVNKAGYCTYYIKGSSQKHTLTLKGKKLYLGKTLVANGINKKSNSFGFAGKKIYYLKDGKIYQSKIATPKKASVVTGKKITYSSKNGQVVVK